MLWYFDEAKFVYMFWDTRSDYLCSMKSYRSLNFSVLARFIVSASVLISVVCCISAPAYIHPCKSIDTACLTKAANEAVPGFINGTPELNISLLDPYFIDRLDFDLVGLKVSFENGTLYGLRKCVIKEISMNLEEQYCKLNAVCDAVLKGTYRANGNILILTIKGEGKAKIKIKEMEFKAKWFFDLEKKADGKKYIILKDGDYKYDVNENMHITLDNLFNGNKELSDVVHTFINNNWKQVFEEFGSPIVNHAIDVSKRNLKKFFGGIPAYELLEVDEFL